MIYVQVMMIILIDNDSIPDYCDDLIDSDFDGVPNDIRSLSNSSLTNGLESNLDGCDLFTTRYRQ